MNDEKIEVNLNYNFINKSKNTFVPTEKYLTVSIFILQTPKISVSWDPMRGPKLRTC